MPAVDATISRICTAFAMHPSAVVLRNELSVVLLQSVLFTVTVTWFRICLNTS
jgi:hypothetical protein